MTTEKQPNKNKPASQEASSKKLRIVREFPSKKDPASLQLAEGTPYNGKAGAKFVRKSSVIKRTVLILALGIAVVLVIIPIVIVVIGRNLTDINNNIQILSDLRLQIEAVKTSYARQSIDTKNLFLRGHIEKELNRYINSINEQATSITTELNKIYDNPTVEPYKEDLQFFEREHEELMSTFGEAIDFFQETEDYKLADSYTRGTGKGAEDILEDIIARLDDQQRRVVQESQANIRGFLITVSIGLIIATLGFALFLSFLLISPIRRLVTFSNRLEKIDVESLKKYEPSQIVVSDEIGSMINTFNNFARVIIDYSVNLEEKVTDRTSALAEANKNLKKTLEDLKQTQTQLLESEKMAALGQLIAGIAHEVNTPAGAIKGAIGEIDRDYSQLLENVVTTIKALDDKLNKIYVQSCQKVVSFGVKEISTREQRQISRTLEDKMEKYGITESNQYTRSLAAIGFTPENIDIVMPLYKQEQTKDATHESLYQLGMSQVHVRDIKIAIERISQLVRALKNYARIDSNEMLETNIVEGIEDTLIILHNKLKHAITVKKDYDEDIPSVVANAEQLNQVWTNLINNAVQAMKGEGTITIRVKNKKNKQILVEIEDSGEGIPEKNLKKIFEAYFTTKPKGEGTGLGLSICKQIIDQHKGKFSVNSQPGKTVFSLTLPIQKLATNKT